VYVAADRCDYRSYIAEVEADQILSVACTLSAAGSQSVRVVAAPIAFASTVSFADVCGDSAGTIVRPCIAFSKQQYTVQITARDRFGNRIREGGHRT